MTTIVVGPSQASPYKTDGDRDDVQIAAAVTALGSGDTLQFERGVTLYSGASVLLKSGLTVDLNGGRLESAGLASGYLLYGNMGVNDVTVKSGTLDGNLDGCGGLSFVVSSGHMVQDVDFVDCDLTSLFFGSVFDSTVSRCTMTCDDSAAGISHGFDMDVSGVSGNCDGITFNSCELENGSRDSTKAENAVNIVYNDCIFHSRVLAGEPVASDVGVTYNDCTFDAVLAVGARSAGTTPTCNRCIFTEMGGAIEVSSNTGGNILLNDNQFYGRNTWYGYASPNWLTVTTVTAAGNHHHNPSNNGGKTVFANPSNTHAWADAAPYTTPQRARTSWESLIEDSNLLENNLNYAIMAGYYTLSGTVSTGLLVATGLVVEGYGGQAAIDMNGQAFDCFNVGAAGAGTSATFKRITVRNASGNFNGTFCTIQSDAVVVFDSCVAEDITGGAGSYGQAFYVEGATCNVTIRNCTFSAVTALSSGGTIRQIGGTMTIEGSRFLDCVSDSAAIRVTSAAVAYTITGTEFIRCSAANGPGVLWIQKASGPISNCTFQGNTGSNYNDGDLGTVATTINNCILADWSELNGTAKTGNYNLIGANSPGGTNVTGTPSYVDSANDNYVLKTGSSGAGQGNLWWTQANPRPTGASGNPFPDRLIDIGANQRRTM